MDVVHALSVCGMRQYMYRTRQVVFGGLGWFTEVE